MSESAVNGMLVVGKITGCYGIKGWLKVHSYTDPPENFLGFTGWHLRRGGTLEPVEFDSGKRHGKGLVAHIKGVDERSLAEAYTGLEIAVSENVLPPLDQGDYYWRDLQGLQVWCQNDKEKVLLGTVDYLIETGANDVLVVKACDGSIDEQERLIPYVQGDVVTRVDLKEAVLEVNWFLEE